MLEVYRGDSKTFDFNFTGYGGAPLNISGCGVFFAVAANYVEHPIIYTGVTGVGSDSVTGLVSITLSSSDTDHCAGDYLTSLRLVCSGSPQTYSTQGLRILPNILPTD